MGAKQSKDKTTVAPASDETNAMTDIISAHRKLEKKSYPLIHQVSHFTPPAFPINPVITLYSMQLCKSTWADILKPVQTDMGMVSGLTVFYTEFYSALEVFDKAGKFEAVLRSHVSGDDISSAKGAILIRIMNFSLSLHPDSDQLSYLLYSLGKQHNYMAIRPWQYSVFIQCLLNTLSSRLGAGATNEVMSAWVNLFAFILRSLLPAAIKGLVQETEYQVNLSEEVSTAKVTDELLEVEEVRSTNKKFKKLQRSRGTSRNVSRTPSEMSDTPSALRTHYE